MFPFGVTYYPDQWPQDTWDETFRQIKAAGFNIVRFGEMAWDWLEPSPGKFSFKELDKAMDLCQKHGLKVLLGIPTSQVPPWFHRKFPGSQPVAQDGTLYPEYGPRPNICKDNSNYRRLATRLATKIAARYAKHPALFGWQLDNEPVYPPLDHTTSNDYCHCEHSRKAFIAWAKNKYGSVKNINEAWGMKFWTNTLAEYDDIRTPKAGIWEAVPPAVFLDWFRFKTESIKSWIEHLAALVRKVDKKHKVGTNGFVGICTRTPEHNLIPANLDWYGLDVYPTGGKMDKHGLAFILDLWRSFTRGTRAEFHITELQGGQNVRWGNPKYVEGSEIKGWVDSALKHGAKAILFHAWRPPLFGAETGGFGILKADGSSTKRLEAIKSIAKQRISNIEFRISNIAIAFLRSSEVQTYQEQGPPRAIAGQWEAARADIGLTHSLDSASGAHRIASGNGKIPVDFIFERDLDNGRLDYKVILLPNPYILSKKQYKNLKDWINKGGLLITEARFGLKDEQSRLYEKPLLEDLFGITYEYTEPTAKGFFDKIAGQAKKEVVIEKKVGQGRAIYVNASLFLQIKNGDKKWVKWLASQLNKA